MQTRKSPAAPARAASKDRDFFNSHVAFPMRDASPVELENFWAIATRDQSELPREHHWECLGPRNVAGRVTSLVIHPDDPDCWSAGSAAGGVWLTTDAGKSWKQTWSRFAPQCIGALGWVKWEGTWTMVAATGEANMHSDAYAGSGLYLSLDYGLRWVGIFGAATPEAGLRGQPRRIGCLTSGSADHMAFGSIYLDETMPAGLYFLHLENMSWEVCAWKEWGERSYNCHSVVYHPDGKTMFAALEPDGTLNGIWRSRNRGKSWEQLTRGLPRGDRFRRASLAISPSNPDVMYVLASDRSRHILGVFRSTNGGNSWKEILGGRFPTERQMDYNNSLAVHPEDPDSVIIGGQKLHRTDDAGRHWQTLTTNRNRSAPNYVHDDHHVILWPAPDTIMSGNDGGVSVSDDGGRTWHERSTGMVTSMFYDLDVAPSSSNVFAGGTQDNGTLVAGVDGVESGDFASAIGGDGAWTVFDPTDAETAFAATSGFEIRRHIRGRAWKGLAGWQVVSPKSNLMEDGEKKQRAFPVIAIDPNSKAGSKRLWAGSARLWFMDTRRRRWQRPSAPFDKSPISAIEISAVNPRVIYVGTTNGGIFCSKDRGVTWSENLAGPDIPARAITSIQAHPIDAKAVVVTIASTGAMNCGINLRTGEHLPYGHVFLSTNSGATWMDLDAGTLPNVAYYAAAFETHYPYRLFVAGDLGVFALLGNDWVHINGNLPNAVVSDLVYHHRDRTLTAATYGRGIWRLSVGKRFVVRPRRRRGQGDAGELRVDPLLETPVQRSPANRAVLRRNAELELAVAPVAAAAGYLFEIVGPKRPILLMGSVETTFNAGSLANLMRGKRARWRVSTIRDGLKSRPSPWRTFVVRG